MVGFVCGFGFVSGALAVGSGVLRAMANQGLVKRINRARVLDAIRRRQPVSRSALADHLGLDRKSLTNLAQELLGEGLVCEAGRRQSGRGRPQTLLALDLASPMVAGLAIDADRISGVLLDIGGGCRSTCRVVLGAQAGVDEILAGVGEVYAGLRLAAAGRLRGVGVAVPGIVDLGTGVVQRSVNLPALEGLDLRACLGRVLPEPLQIEESSRAKALAEKWFGLAQEAPNFVCIDLGIGIGAGLVQDRRPYMPAGGYAGEIGHVMVDPQGPWCRCGHRGCLEACISERRLLERLNAAEGTAWAALEAVPGVTARSRPILEEAGYRLGLALAYLTNIICPPLIILNGSLLRFADCVMPAIERGLEAGALADCRARVRLVVSALAEAGAMGAAARVLAEVYEVDGHVQV